MTTDELKKEAEEYAIDNYELIEEGQRSDQRAREQAYLSSAEPREKRIAELETQIEKMKCCGNCRWEYPCSFCDDCKRLEGQIFAETLTSDNWEMK
jgi:recombinational DNA repair protein RecR